MKYTFDKRCIFTALFILITAVFPVKAQIGFQATLATPPSFVSPYYEISDQFSVAVYPKSYANLSTRLRLHPRATYSNFYENSIRFETVYFALGPITKSLVPVSVDADRYFQFLSNKNINDKFLDYTRQSITATDKKGRRSGLGISVSLPKRLDKIFGEGGGGSESFRIPKSYIRRAFAVDGRRGIGDVPTKQVSLPENGTDFTF